MMSVNQSDTSIDLRDLKNTIGQDPNEDMDKPNPSPIQKTAPVPRQQEIILNYTDPDGVAHNATIIAQIKNGQQRVQVGRLAAVMVDNVPWGTLPPIVQARVWALSNVTIGLNNPPEWVLKWIQEDDSLLFGLSQELEEHESTYFRGYIGEGAENQEQQRVVIRKADPSAYTALANSSNITGSNSG